MMGFEAKLRIISLSKEKKQPFSGGPSFSESWVNGATKRKPSVVKARESRQLGVSLNGGTPIKQPKMIIYAPGVCWGSLRLLDLLVLGNTSMLIGTNWETMLNVSACVAACFFVMSQLLTF